MIAYPDALSGLDDEITAKAGTWLDRAAVRTNEFAAAGHYFEKRLTPAGNPVSASPFWSEVKSVYIRRQHNKCLYCEKKLEGKAFASVEWDLEHFRPKGRVRPWPRNAANFGYDFETGAGSDLGYYLLAYHPHNYGAACKTCNSPFKSDFFPVAKARVQGMPDPRDYAAEEPFLAYPLGTRDEDPASLICFNGVTAMPRHSPDSDMLRWRRARIMIDFFGLNRDGLTSERASWLVSAVWPSYRLHETGDPRGDTNLSRVISERAPFTNCTRCFLDICRNDRPLADRMIGTFEQIVDAMET